MWDEDGFWLNPIPCMLFCGYDMCNCVARIYYEEEDDWLILDKKAQQEKSPYERYCARLQDMGLNAFPEAGLAELKATSTSQTSAISSVLK